MSPVLNDKIINAIRDYSDLSVDAYGISCVLYIPTNLTDIQSYDMYTVPSEILYKKHDNQKVFIEWHARDIEKLRKLGMFTEDEAPIIAWFKMIPEITIKSYIVLDQRYVPDKYDVDSFEIVDILMRNIYSSEVLRVAKLAPRRINA